MDQRLEQGLFDNYPVLYKYTNSEAATEEFDSAPPITYDGIVCDDGWYTLLNVLSSVLESINDSRDEPIHALQLKEKHGSLRITTTDHPPEAEGIIQTIRALSRLTCERCGTTDGAQPHHNGGGPKTLCEPCALDWQNIDDEIEIWQFTMECFKCETETPVVYPQQLGGNHGGTWETVGPILKNKSYCSVQQHFSNVQKKLVWGNTCRNCGAYQGNYYVYEAAQEYVQQADGWYPLADFDCIDIIERTK